MVLSAAYRRLALLIVPFVTSVNAVMLTDQRITKTRNLESTKGKLL